MNDFREYIGVDYTPYLMHYGKSVVDGAPGRGSGRYPRGSGENPRAEYVSRMSTIHMSAIAKGEKGFKIASKRIKRAEPKPEALEDLKKLYPMNKTSVHDARARINSSGKSIGSYIGNEYNCQNCSTAFELIERGYDVVARMRPQGSNVGDIESFYKNGRLTKVRNSNGLNAYKKMTHTANEIDSLSKERSSVGDQLDKAVDEHNADILKEKYNQIGKDIRNLNKLIDEQYFSLAKESSKSLINGCKSYGSNTRGVVVVGWLENPMDQSQKPTSFHAFNYKVENDQVKFYDCQSHREEKQNGGVNIEWVLEGSDPRDIYIMRTDNLELDPSITQAVYSNGRKK